MAVTLGFLATVLAAPAVSADTTTVCALDPVPPCAQITHGSATGDGDCDESNGAGTVAHGVQLWTGPYPAGNSSVRVQNECGSEDYAVADLTVYTPLSFYPTKWVGVYWAEHSAGCFAVAYTGGRYGPNTYQDLSVICTVLGGPPILP